MMTSQHVSTPLDPQVEAVHQARPQPPPMAGGHHALIKDHVENRAGQSRKGPAIEGENNGKELC